MGVYGGPDIVEDGLVLCLDAGNSRSYSGSGTTWNNLLGGTAFNIGGASYTQNTLVYSGGNSNGYESVSNAYSFSTSVPYTIQVGFKPTKLGDSTSNCGDKRTTLWSKQGSTWWGHLLRIYPSGSNPDSSTGSLAYQVNGSTADSAQNRSISTSISINQTYDLTTQFVPSNNTYFLRLYLNSNLIQQSTSANLSFIPNEILRIGGRDNNCTNGSFTGAIYYFRMYNRELSAGEIAQNFAATRGRFGI